MSNLTREEIASAASAAGFTGNDVNIAVAVALAESGGNPRSHNAVPPDNSYGLWQINMLGSLGPDRRKRFGLKSNEDLYNPSTNAKAAYGIFKGSGWKAWTTYTSGKYKLYYKNTASSSDVAPGTTPSGSTPASINPILGVGDAINAFGSTILKGIANISGIAFAIALVVIGVVFLLRDTIPVVKTAKTLKNVADKVGS